MKENFHKPTTPASLGGRGFSETELGRKLLAMLQNGSPAQMRFADYVLRNPVVAASKGIEDLAATAEVSAATISRITRDLGAESYSAFRTTLGETIGAVLDPVSKLREGLSRRIGEGAAADSLAAARGHLSALAGEDVAARFTAVCAHIAAAREVYVMGFGLSAHLAGMLALGLQPYRERVINTVQFGGTEVAAGRLMDIGASDLLIAITFPRYAGDIVDLARFARDRGARIVAITDSAAAPLARYADDLLLAPAIHPVLSSSGVAGLAVIEALVSEFMMSNPENLQRAERLTAALRRYIHQEDG